MILANNINNKYKIVFALPNISGLPSRVEGAVGLNSN
jgi:hypothetical protein